MITPRADERWVVLHAGSMPDLQPQQALRNDPARRAAVRDRLTASLDAQAPALVDALRDSLVAADPHATVEVRERLWLDGSLVAQVHADPSRIQAGAGRTLDALLDASGAGVLDPGALPGDLDHAVAAATASRPAATQASSSTPAPDATPVDQWFAADLGLDAARARGLDGRGVRVAVVDAGVDTAHPELAAAAARGATFDPFVADAGTRWGSGHATFVAGLAVGSRTGAAPGATLLNARTYASEFGDVAGASDAARRAYRVNATRALQWSLAPGGDAAAGADLLVTSWGVLGSPGQPDPTWDRAAHSIAAAGAVLVAAAGNDGGDPASGRSTLATPAMLPDAIAVGGTDRAWHHHPQASVGPSPRTDRPKPDIAEPVVDVRSLAPDGGRVDTAGNDGGGFAGTSAAAPLAAGVLALLAQAVHDRGGATPDLADVQAVLPTLAGDVDAPGPDAGTGFGVLGAWRVEQAADAIVARHG